MSRLASFLTALWLSSAAANPGRISDVATSAKKHVTSEVQAGIHPIGKSIAFIGGGLCKHVKPIVGVAYEDYQEPDMSKLTLVFQNRAKTVTYNLTEAPEEIPKERWYNPELPLKLYIHGFTDNPSRRSFKAMNRAFAEEVSKGNMNILALDASSLIAFWYLRATTMVRFIGEKLGTTLAALLPAGLDPKNIHLIGHSLGSHIAGFTGKLFYLLTGFHVGRISSLDPAGPCFGNLEPRLRLSKEDADFVDVIHTDAGVYGLNQQIGHVDFWPNGGKKQPGCLLQTCSHSRAWWYYSNSVRYPESFIAVKCNNYYEFRHGLCDYNDTSVMGYGTPTNTRGVYFCQTLGKEPFGAGDEGLTYKETAVVGAVSNTVKDALLSAIHKIKHPLHQTHNTTLTHNNTVSSDISDSESIKY